MILLSDNHLIFKLPNGESVLVSPDTICVDLAGNSCDPGSSFDTEFIRAAASAVFHYFKNDLGRDTVTLSDFSEALEKILRGFALEAVAAEPAAPDTEADLRLLAAEAGKTELLFYSRLRAEVRSQLRDSPGRLRFRGLRGCVKQLAGARRWSPRCRRLQEQIMEFLHRCTTAETGECVLVVK
jgi:hypothetical protein